MPYLFIFVFEIVLLWVLARTINSKLVRFLPTPLYVAFFLPGTFLHELSHFVTAKILAVPVGKFSVRPQKREEEIVLGSVAIAKTNFIKRFLIGVSPFAFGLAAIVGVSYLTIEGVIAADWKVLVLVGYFVFVVGNTMFASKKDLEGAWKMGAFVLLAVAVLYLVEARIGVNESIFKMASIYLSPAIAIDVAMVIALSLKGR